MSMSRFDNILLRLKQELQVTRDKEVSAVLGLGSTNLAARKKRGTFPELHLRAAAQKHPELGIDVDYVLTGKKTEAADAAGRAKASVRRREAQINEALSVLSRDSGSVV